MALLKFDIDGCQASNTAGQPLEFHKADDWESMYYALKARAQRLQKELDLANQKVGECGWKMDNTRWGL